MQSGPVSFNYFQFLSTGRVGPSDGQNPLGAFNWSWERSTVTCVSPTHSAIPRTSQNESAPNQQFQKGCREDLFQNPPGWPVQCHFKYTSRLEGAGSPCCLVSIHAEINTRDRKISISRLTKGHGPHLGMESQLPIALGKQTKSTEPSGWPVGDSAHVLPW